MKKKGFTLIELLAVIIILAVIALIATPVVLNVVENARREANKNSVYGIMDSAKLYYTESLLDSSKKSNINGTTNLINEISISGKRPESGVLYINNKGETALALVYGEVCYKKNFTETDLTESEDTDNCTIDTGTPSVPSEPEVTAYYEFGTPTTLSSTNYQDVITSSGSNVIIRLQEEQLSVCIYINETLECFENNNYEVEKEHIETLFGIDACAVDVSELSCFDDNFYCSLDTTGYVSCDSMQKNCILNGDDTVNCY